MFRASTHPSDTTIEIGVLPFFGDIPAPFSHLGEMVGTVFVDVRHTTFAGNGAVMLAASFFFEGRATFAANALKIILTIFLANSRSPTFTRLRLRHCGGLRSQRR